VAAVAAGVVAWCTACGADDAAVVGLPTFTPSAASTTASGAAAGAGPATTTAPTSAPVMSSSPTAEAGDQADVERVYRGYMAAKVTLGASGVPDPAVLRPWATEQLATSDAEALGLLFKADRRMFGTISAQVRSVVITGDVATLVACNDSSTWEAFTVKAGRTEGPDMVYRNKATVSEAKLVREGDTWRMDDYYRVAPAC
jgi:hypothetical protein